jgi:predicted nuclease with TOPRIM domain
MTESDPQELADQLEQETARLQDEIERLGDEVSSTREDWEQKRSDAAVPGAPPADDQA